MKSTCLPRILSCCLVLLSGCASVEVQRERALAALRSAESAMAAQPVSSGFDDPRAVAGQLRKGLHNLALGPSRPVIDIHGIATPSPHNLLGAKGAGEAGCIGVPAALMNAARDALAPLGECDLQFPLTAEQLWRAMNP